MSDSARRPHCAYAVCKFPTCLCFEQPQQENVVRDYYRGWWCPTCNAHHAPTCLTCPSQQLRRPLNKGNVDARLRPSPPAANDSADRIFDKMIKPHDGEIAGRVDALLSGLNAQRLPDGRHFPSDAAAIIGFAEWYTKLRSRAPGVTRADIVAVLRSFDEPRVGSPEALADPLRAKKWEDGKHDAAAKRADAMMSLITAATESAIRTRDQIKALLPTRRRRDG